VSPAAFCHQKHEDDPRDKASDMREVRDSAPVRPESEFEDARKELEQKPKPDEHDGGQAYYLYEKEDWNDCQDARVG
jgi:hypothetical protein